MFRSIHFFNRILCLILILISLFIVQNIYFFYGIHLFLFILYMLEKDNKSIDFIIISAILLFFQKYYYFFFLICKALILFSIISNFLFLLTRKEKKIFIEKFFYPSGNVSSILRVNYYNSLFSYHKSKFNELKDVLTPKRKYKKYILEQAKRKTEVDLKQKELLWRSRFYGNSWKRTNFFHFTFRWINQDNTYFFLHLVLLIIVILYN